MLRTSSPAQGQARPPPAPTSPHTLQPPVHKREVPHHGPRALPRTWGAGGARRGLDTGYRPQQQTQQEQQTQQRPLAECAGTFEAPRAASCSGPGRGAEAGLRGAADGVLPVDTGHPATRPREGGRGEGGDTESQDPATRVRRAAIREARQPQGGTALPPPAQRQLPRAKLASAESPLASHRGFPPPLPLFPLPLLRGVALGCSPPPLTFLSKLGCFSQRATFSPRPPGSTPRPHLPAAGPAHSEGCLRVSLWPQVLWAPGFLVLGHVGWCGGRESFWKWGNLVSSGFRKGPSAPDLLSPPT